MDQFILLAFAAKNVKPYILPVCSLSDVGLEFSALYNTNDNNMMRAKLNLTFQKIQFNISNIILYKAPVKCFKDS